MELQAFDLEGLAANLLDATNEEDVAVENQHREELPVIEDKYEDSQPIEMLLEVALTQILDEAPVSDHGYEAPTVEDIFASDQEDVDMIDMTGNDKAPTPSTVAQPKSPVPESPATEPPEEEPEGDTSIVGTYTTSAAGPASTPPIRVYAFRPAPQFPCSIGLRDGTRHLCH